MAIPQRAQRITLAGQKRALHDLVKLMTADLDGATKQERIKLYGNINDSQKTILDIKKMQDAKETRDRLKLLEKEKKKPHDPKP